MAPVKDMLGRGLRDLRISVTDRCNFRCQYCMPITQFGPGFRFLPRADILTFEEVVRVVEAATDLGVRKVRLTGGEPLLRRDLATLVALVAAVPGVEDLALTSNGSLLSRQVADLARAGLGRVTVSLDSIDPQVFQLMNGVGLGIEPVLAGIEAAVAAGLAPIKLNAVVRRGLNDGGILELADFARRGGHILRFIEYMDVGESHGWRLDEVVPSREVLSELAKRWPLRPLEQPPGSGVARRYSYLDGGGEVGVISSVTAPFCGSCSRLRLTANGRLHTCLFSREGHDLRALIRSGAGRQELAQAMSGIWGGRVDRYSELRSASGATDTTKAKPEMSYLGG